jgi:hypothetical protein
MFIIEFTEKALRRDMGVQWSPMVVITAVHIRLPKGTGGATKAGIKSAYRSRRLQLSG